MKYSETKKLINAKTLNNKIADSCYEYGFCEIYDEPYIKHIFTPDENIPLNQIWITWYPKTKDLKYQVQDEINECEWGSDDTIITLEDFYEQMIDFNQQPIIPAQKGGRCWNGAHRDAGAIVHAVESQPPTTGGYWGNKALCGAEPGRRGYGWTTTNNKINCEKCLKRMP